MVETELQFCLKYNKYWKILLKTSHISRTVLGTQVAQRSVRYLSTHNHAETSDTLHKITTSPLENV